MIWIGGSTAPIAISLKVSQPCPKPFQSTPRPKLHFISQSSSFWSAAVVSFVSIEASMHQAAASSWVVPMNEQFAAECVYPL